MSVGCNFYRKKEYPKIADKLFVARDRLSELEDGSYDVVTMFDVIEHIPDVEVYLKEDVFRILRGVYSYFRHLTKGLILYLK